jgi:hypothetical protein
VLRVTDAIIVKDAKRWTAWLPDHACRVRSNESIRLGDAGAACAALARPLQSVAVIAVPITWRAGSYVASFPSGNSEFGTGVTLAV